jgi:hypothetical protein
MENKAQKKVESENTAWCTIYMCIFDVFTVACFLLVSQQWQNGEFVVLCFLCWLYIVFGTRH